MSPPALIFLLRKLVQLFLQPLNLMLLLLAAASLWRGSRLRRLLSIGGFLLLWFFSCSVGSKLLLASLEYQYAARKPEALPKADVIVVLGGGTELPAGRQRLMEAAQAFRAGRAPLVLFSGGKVSPLRSEAEPLEAQAARVQLEGFGVPETAIRVEARSRNTHENAVFSRQVLGGTRHILLVTSAFHMPRAAAAFHKAGFEVEAVPSDFASEPPGHNKRFRNLPQLDYLLRSKTALREWFGLVVYRARGWV